jgi:hypothetical protein
MVLHLWRAIFVFFAKVENKDFKIDNFEIVGYKKDDIISK